MENYINSILTLTLIAIYWFNTKAQNQKIKAQSDIINDLKEHVKFFDLKKIKEYVQLQEEQKDKLLYLTKAALEKEFEFKSTQIAEPITTTTASPQVNTVKNVGEIDRQKIVSLLSEFYMFFIKNYILKDTDELEETLTKNFPNNKDSVKEMMDLAKKEVAKHFKVNSFEEALELLRKMDNSAFAK